MIDWKHLLWTETSQKSLVEIFCYYNKVTRKVKDFQKLSYKEIYFTIQSNITKYNKPFKFILSQTSLRNTKFSVLISGVKLLLIGLRNVLMGKYINSFLYKLIYFLLPLNPAIHRMGNTLNVLCPRCKEQKNSHPYFIFHWKLSKIALDFIHQ